MRVLRYSGLALSTVLMFPLSIAYAHIPLEVESDNNRLLNSVRIPDHKISRVIYQEIQNTSEVDYYSFDAKTDDELYVEMTIPKLAGLESFTPSIALIGYGINSELIKQHSTNISIVEISPNALGNYDALSLQVPANTSIVIVNYNGTVPSTEFYEPFTQTSYWERQKLIVEKLPSTGTYFLAVFDRQHEVQDNGVEKYTLAVGKIEDFTIIDYVVTMPVAWFNTKFFFNDYLTPSIAIILLIMIPSSLATLVHFHKLREE